MLLNNIIMLHVFKHLINCAQYNTHVCICLFTFAKLYRLIQEFLNSGRWGVGGPHLKENFLLEGQPLGYWIMVLWRNKQKKFNGRLNIHRFLGPTAVIKHNNDCRLQFKIIEIWINRELLFKLLTKIIAKSL